MSVEREYAKYAAHAMPHPAGTGRLLARPTKMEVTAQVMAKPRT